MYTLTVSCQKGGTGKTTTAVAVGAELSRAGYRVLFVDCDAQANMTKAEIEAPFTGGKLAPLYGSEPEYRIKRALQAVENDFDVCIIDTAPTLGEMTIAALVAADGVIVPVRADRYSLYGLQDFHNTFMTVKEQTTNRAVKLLGVVITQYSGRSSLARDIADAIRDQAKKLKTKVYEPPVRSTISATEWQYTGYTVGSTAQKDYAVIAQQIISDIKKRR